MIDDVLSIKFEILPPWKIKRKQVFCCKNKPVPKYYLYQHQLIHPTMLTEKKMFCDKKINKTTNLKFSLYLKKDDDKNRINDRISIITHIIIISRKLTPYSMV